MKTTSRWPLSNFMLMLPLVGVVVALGIVSHQMVRRTNLTDDLKQTQRDFTRWYARYKQAISRSAPK